MRWLIAAHGPTHWALAVQGCGDGEEEEAVGDEEVVAGGAQGEAGKL